MKRTISVLIGLIALLAVALPAHADPPNNDAIIGAGGCSNSLNIDNDANITGSLQSTVTMVPLGNPNHCAFIEMKVRIQKCDGTTSTGPAINMFNPPPGNFNLDVENFSCESAGIIGIFARSDSTSGVWNPNASGDYIYYFVGPPEGCFPAYCIL